MCGIAFSLCREDRETSHARMQAAVSSMHHRGPDEHNVLSHGNAFLGHARLSIVDLGGSHQPMTSPDGRYCLTFNGEIYNYLELKAQLASGWQFQSQGDTEVLLAGLCLHGVNFLRQLSGMWAFALWDSHEESLLLSRDPTGKKPLFYSSRHLHEIYIASEIPALSKLTPYSWSEHLASTADYFRYGNFLPGTTIYQEVREVLPGTYLSWKPGGQAESQPYWSLSLGGKRVPEALKEEQLTSLFNNAVSKRMIADVEVGAFLSGGVDSSLVVAAIAKSGRPPPKTFTIRFNNASYDESPYAAEISKLFSTQHHVECFDSMSPEDYPEILINHLGQPFADASILPTYLVSKAASAKVKVVLSGDGGDELFSGYQRYFARVVLMWYSRLPAALRALGEKLLRFFPEPDAHHSRSILKRAHLFMDAARAYSEDPVYIAPRLISPSSFKRLIPEIASLGHSAPNAPRQSSPDDLQSMMARDLLIYLPQDILQKVDRASMASSLEVRSPFLDKDLIEFAFSLPSKDHRHWGNGKKLLKQALGDWLPRSTWDRNKQGFGIPLHLWFRDKLGQQLRELLHSTQSPLCKKEVESLLSENQNGNRDHGLLLWATYSYLLWYQNTQK